MKNSFDFSPRLKKAMDEIQQVLNKHDINGLVVLHTKQYGEFYAESMLKVDAKSCAKIEKGAIRIRATKAEKDKILYTTNMFHLMSEVVGQFALALINISEQIDCITEAEHTDTLFLPHNSNDN